MKKLFLILILLVSIAFAGPALAEDITFAWEQEISADFAGWKLYQSTVSGGPYELATTIQYGGDPLGTYASDLTIPAVVGAPVDYYFVMAAFDTAGNESTYSNEVKWTAEDTTPPGIPITLTVTIKQQ